MYNNEPVDVGVPTNDYTLSWDSLQFEATVGSGAFGTVLKASMYGTPVAVKQIHLPEEGNEEEQKILNIFVDREKAMTRFHHPHFVQFIGLVEHDGYIYLVTEYVPGGDLRKYLKKPDVHMSWGLRVDIALDVARAMAFLHSKGVMHRDIKSKNILVGESWKMKVCDFGFARSFTRDGKKRYTLCGTEDWMAPELILGDDYDEKVDVFSYGIVLLEIITRLKLARYVVRRPENAYGLDPTEIIPLLPTECPDEFKILALSCTAWASEDRPSFIEVISKLGQIKQALANNSTPSSPSSAASSPSKTTLSPSTQRRNTAGSGTTTPTSSPSKATTTPVRTTLNSSGSNSLTGSPISPQTHRRDSLPALLGPETDSIVEDAPPPEPTEAAGNVPSFNPNSPTPGRATNSPLINVSYQVSPGKNAGATASAIGPKTAGRGRGGANTNQSTVTKRPPPLSKSHSKIQLFKRNETPTGGQAEKLTGMNNVSQLTTLSFKNKEEFYEGMRRTFPTSVKNGYLLLGYSKDTELQYLDSSPGGSVKELVSKLADDQIQYALLRVPVTLATEAESMMQGTNKGAAAPGPQGGENKTRDIFIAWTGPKVGILQRGKKKAHIGELMRLLSPFHAELTAVNREHFDEKTVIEKSNALSGSHVID
eukprot:TRINITY_DN5881_c0_g1_i1.p1 TRINITY_DN5881_c0_g1~~TRINITY_DN5881_c0_g1_i1.p1  ORF type:complete len:651 (-),score=156.16 TRINITY_DN5881_c0_g1_i1:135-2087(-)